MFLKQFQLSDILYLYIFLFSLMIQNTLSIQSLFSNKEEVIELHLDTLFHIYIEEFIHSKQDFTIKDLCDNTISYLIKQKKLIQIMVRSNLDHVVKDRIESYLLLLWTTKRDNQNYAIAFLTGALMSVISLAVKNDEFDNETKISELIEEIITGKYFQP